MSPQDPSDPPRPRAGSVDGDTTPLRGASVRIEGGCAQPARISRPSSFTSTRTTSRLGGDFSCSGGLSAQMVQDAPDGQLLVDVRHDLERTCALSIGDSIRPPSTPSAPPRSSTLGPLRRSKAVRSLALGSGQIICSLEVGNRCCRQPMFDAGADEGIVSPATRAFRDARAVRADERGRSGGPDASAGRADGLGGRRVRR